MFLFIDNYDSFTYNLVQYFQMLGQDPVVLHNDDPRLLEIAADPALEKVVISPGPSHPAKSGLCLEFLKRLPHHVPVLGVCLGHEILGMFAGAPVEVGPVIMHGMQSDIKHDGQGIYFGMPNPLRVGRYHSLVVVSDEEHPNPNFTVTARGPLGEVMSLRYNDRPWIGLQYHPESVLTPAGMRLLARFPETIRPEDEGAAAASAVAGKPAMTMASVLDCIEDGNDLSAEQAEFAFSQLLDGNLSAAQSGAFLAGLRAKGESPLELACVVKATLARAVKVPAVPDDALDIVGTGGDGKHSFNCSTTAGLTLAGLGYHVVKHGNRAVSSTSGAADLLESIGVPLEKDPEKVVDYLKKTNFAFFMAPFYHPAFRFVGPVRKELGVRTLFNMLGPMINPARPPYLLMGVAKQSMVRLIAETLAQQPTLRRAAVVHGAGGYDEVTAMGPADILLLENGAITPMTLDPARYGFTPATVEELAVESREQARDVVVELLQGRGPKPMQDMVILNAGLAMYLIEKDSMSLDECMEKASAAVRSGAGSRFVNAAR